jgi:SPP1 gp7 family putative phage head morphogenesis protein
MDFLFGPAPHQEAVNFIQDKPVVSRQVFNGLLPELKARAFTIAGVEAANVLQSVRDRIADLPAGANWDDVKKDVANDISPFLVDPNETDPDKRDGQVKAAARRAELLLRTHGFQAYQSAACQVMDRQKDVLPYWQYLTMEDEKVRPEHAALDQLVLPADDPFWEHHTGPWDWGCRCQRVALSKEDHAEIKAADAKRPTDEKLVVEGPLLSQINNGQLVRAGRSFDIRPPHQKGEGSAFQWNWKDLRLPLDQLKARYDAPVWDQFEAWSKATPLQGEGSPTVWQWLGGDELVARPGGAVGAWPDLGKLQVVRALGGSTGAVLVQDPATAEFFVRKTGNSPEHLRNEVAADEAYRALGLNVPEAKLYDTPQGPVKLARFVEGKTLGSLQGAARAAAQAELRKGFAADALLGNYDVIGLEEDNILVDKAGKVWRIDNGGSFDFRAQGAKKTTWNGVPKDLWSMRDAAVNPAAGATFGALGIFAIARQIEQLDLPALMDRLPEGLKDVVSARAGNLKDVARKALDMEHDQWKDGYADQLTFHTMGLREAGVTAALPAKMVKRGQVELVDENGLEWDHLRTPSSRTPASYLAADAHAANLLGIIKHINHHGAGDKKLTKAKITQLNQIARALKNILVTQEEGSDEHAAATHYLKKAQEAQASAKTVEQPVFIPVTHFEAYKSTPKAGTKAFDSESVVAKAARYIESQGGDQQIAASWMESQAGNSWSSGVRAYKYFISRQLNTQESAVWWGERSSTRRAAEKAAAQKAYSSLTTVYGAEKVEKSLIAWHALVQETLAQVDFGYNDRERRAVRLVRTENQDGIAANHVSKGKDRQMARGLNESSSIYRRVSVSGSEDTVQAVPHSRVTGMYFLERTPGSKDGSFMSDGENEFTFIPAGVPFDYKDNVGFTGRETDATKWNLNLEHLRA